MLIYAVFCSFIFANLANSVSGEKFIWCASQAGSINRIADDGEAENVSSEITHQKCYTNYCYTVWQENGIGNESSIMGQGCWSSSGKPNVCDKENCTADNKPPKAMNTTKFCCCSSDMCNENYSDTYKPAEEPPPPDLPHKESISMTFIWLIISFLYCLWFIFLYLSYVSGFWRRKKNLEDVESSQPLPPSTDYSLEKLKLLNVIGQGRYGSVWRGLIDHQEIAVKMFPSHHRNYFLNEHNMYKVSGENAALLRCFGGGEYVSSPGGPADYLLLLSLEQECLQEYLKKHVIDVQTLGRMSLGVAKGLAHLHSDLGKPCIAHRDVNTRNILVRSDLSCCLCDLGLAVVPRSAENKSLTEAGTFRYMAPEVLEGAVNLRDCESALKQIDVYALGLVLWEMGARCADMQNCEPPPYAPPFHKEAGENPSLEQMQTLVSRRKARPLWPPSWKDTTAARLLCETAEDCWDQDAEARLTSLCVVERLLELPLLKGRVLHPMHPPASPTPLINNNHLHDRRIDVSVGTIETLLSPSEENCKNSNQTAAAGAVHAVVTPLQPYQGRNPCLERNLNSISGASSDDFLLIDKSFKHCLCSGGAAANNLDSRRRGEREQNPFNGYQVNQRAAPIPYLQNAVRGSPKRLNKTKDDEETCLEGDKTMGSSSPLTRFNRYLRRFFKNSINNGKKMALQNNDVGGVGGCRQTQVKLNGGKLTVNGYGAGRNCGGAVGVTTTLLGVGMDDVDGGDEEREVVVKRPSTLPLTTITPGKRLGEAESRSKETATLLSRQRSMEHFNEVFSSTGDLTRLKDPSSRVKTPGDVPPSVRRTRGRAARESASTTTSTSTAGVANARFSLYDDRMMGGARGQWCSAPDLEPPPIDGACAFPFPQLKHPHIDDLRDRDSVSSF